MQTVYPDYYSEFQCIAAECRHTCCAGWEIDIDEETLGRYRRTEGDMGRRLQAAIASGEEPHFILEAGERCPFLNKDNLCDLILYGGEEMLCQICTDHPRFRSFLPGRTEIGLGLCCEAAGQLILGRKEPAELCETGEAETSDEDGDILLALRAEAIAAAQDRSRSLEERMERILALCGSTAAVADPVGWVPFYRELERLEARWDGVLDGWETEGAHVDMESFRAYMRDRETEYEQLLVYFLYRHFLKAYDDGEAAGKAAFAVLSTRILMLLGAVHYERHGEFTLADQVEYARRYSGEIEYSEENLEALFDALAEAF